MAKVFLFTSLYIQVSAIKNGLKHSHITCFMRFPAHLTKLQLYRKQDIVFTIIFYIIDSLKTSFFGWPQKVRLYFQPNYYQGKHH